VLIARPKFRTHLVPQTLGGDDGDLIANTLVGLEVEGELGVVPLDDDLGGLLDGLGSNCSSKTPRISLLPSKEGRPAVCVEREC
jgi:hypothetical protein